MQAEAIQRSYRRWAPIYDLAFGRITQGGRILAELPLPVAGLMSLEPFETVRDRLETLRAAAKSLGVTLEEPFLQLAFLALPVIPALKITDRGMVDVERFEIIAAG